LLLVLEHQLRLSTGGHQAAQIGIVLVVYGLIHLWLRANTVALIEADRKQGRLKITVMESHPSWRPAMPSANVAAVQSCYSLIRAWGHWR
jgi:hypothetical protein